MSVTSVIPTLGDDNQGVKRAADGCSDQVQRANERPSGMTPESRFTFERVVGAERFERSTS